MGAQGVIVDASDDSAQWQGNPRRSSDVTDMTSQFQNLLSPSTELKHREFTNGEVDAETYTKKLEMSSQKSPMRNRSEGLASPAQAFERDSGFKPGLRHEVYSQGNKVFSAGKAGSASVVGAGSAEHFIRDYGISKINYNQYYQGAGGMPQQVNQNYLNQQQFLNQPLDSQQHQYAGAQQQQMQGNSEYFY